MNGGAAGVQCSDTGWRHDGELFVCPERQALEECCLACARFTGKKNVTTRRVDELQRGLHLICEFNGLGLRLQRLGIVVQYK